MSTNTQRQTGRHHNLTKRLPKQVQLLQTTVEEDVTEKMLSFKTLVPVFALCFFIDELYAFLLPDRLQSARTALRLTRDASPHLSEISDLAEFMPDNGGEMTRDWEPNPAKSATALSLPVEHIPAQPKPQRHKSKDKRVRVTVPLDRIGNSYLSSRNRKDEPEDIWEHDG